MFELVCVKDAVCEGDAQVIGMRGKRKHVCDITATITWIVNIKEEKQSNAQSTDSSHIMDVVDDDNLTKKNDSTKNTTDKEGNNDEKEKEKDEDVVLKMIIRDITADKDFEFEYTHPKISATFTQEHKKVLTNSL